mmetsp:Transcript_25874/g.103414  ORF Transcript_25874/g.103414 Transcript_25874/m.103414 type:complete len:372 (-) Transcript_25874:688-1803(-)
MMSGNDDTRAFTTTTSVELHIGALDGAEPFQRTIRMPLVGLGTAHLLEHEILAGIDAGARHLDCAPIYGNEAAVGRAIKRSGVARAELFVTTKVWNDAHRPALARQSVLASLEDLQLDAVDLVLLHWPTSWRPGTVLCRDAHVVDWRATWCALSELVREGKVRALGVSNFDAAQLDALTAAAHGQAARVCVNQIEAHPQFQNGALVAACQERGVQCVAWGPLAKGRSALRADARLAAVAAKRGIDATAVALRWNLDRGVAVVPKSTNPANVAANLKVAALQPLDKDDAALLALCETGRRRFPDVVGVWPSTAWRLAGVVGVVASIVARCVFFFVGPVDLVALSKRRHRQKEAAFLLRCSSAHTDERNEAGT